MRTLPSGMRKQESLRTRRPITGEVAIARLVTNDPAPTATTGVEWRSSRFRGCEPSEE